MVSESTDLGREKMRLEDSTPAGRDGQHSPVPPVSEPARRRRRPAVSCTNCRRRKVKCNRELPCSNCVAFQKEPCVYDGYPPLCRRLSRPPSQQETSGLADVSATLLYTQGNAPSASATNQSSPREDILSMKSRIKQLEDELATVTSRLSGSSMPTPRSNSEFTSSFLGGGIQIRHECRFHGQVQEIGHGLMHKTRLFGQSHWMNGVALVWNLLEVLEPYMRDGQSPVAAKLQRCKSLARTIKICREPPWPTLLNASVPDRHISDKLVDCYLRTVETVYRIVHIPSFKRSYESLWTSSGPPDLNVVAQVKMVLAIGATMFDDSFSLRNEAVRWIFEVQTWLLRPRFKAQLNLQTLQTEILLILAREMVGVDSSATWVSISLIMRKAVQMGLHRDPAKLAKGSVFASEMRKRLFNTILELALQSSILSGGSPFIYPEEFDTEGPGNFDDEQLMEENPSPKADKHFTQSSMARLLARTFSERLAIANVLNSVNAGDSYEETLRLDSQLRAAYKDARKRFLPDGSLAATGESASHFASTFVEVLVNRYLLALHLPFHIPSLTNAGYAFSRKVVSDVSIKIWRSLFQLPVITAAAATDQGYNDITRLTTSPWSFFHTLLRQVPLAICTELGAQLREEEDSLGPVPLRSDWVTIMEQAKVWFFRCIEIWNTNVKGYLLMRIVAGPIEAYMQSLDKDKVAQYLVYTAEEALEKCLAVLEKAAANVQPLPRTESALVESMAQSDAVIPAVVDPSTTMGEDWDFMMADAEFNFGSAEPIDWLFDETTWKL